MFRHNSECRSGAPLRQRQYSVFRVGIAAVSDVMTADTYSNIVRENLSKRGLMPVGKVGTRQRFVGVGVVKVP